jgi:hypothetical protein
MNQVKQAFKTAENTILIVTANTKGCNGRPYVSITANKIYPILKNDAIERCREYLENGELWRDAVIAESTELGLHDWINWVISIDGELSGFDNSLYPVELNIDGEDYIFDSHSCGCLHDDIKEATNKFDTLIGLHLKDDKQALTEADKLILAMQKDAEVDIDFLIEKFTREIIGIES